MKPLHKILIPLVLLFCDLGYAQQEILLNGDWRLFSTTTIKELKQCGIKMRCFKNWKTKEK